MRLDKFISEIGAASRKEAALAAKRGQLTVDGEVVRDTSRHISPEINRVVFMGRELEYSKYTYIMLNKPEGYVSATDDRSLPYVTELLPEELRRRELFPVGRLDKDTVGLMILTNNGKLAHRLLSPKKHVKKVYRFSAKVPMREGAEDEFREGVTLSDGYECKPSELSLDDDRLGGYITLTEGKYHQIKRMVAATDNRVISLKRVSFAGITLDEALGEGEWRFLTEKEVEMLENVNN